MLPNSTRPKACRRTNNGLGNLAAPGVTQLTATVTNRLKSTEYWPKPPTTAS